MAKGRRGSEEDEDIAVETHFSDETEEEEEEGDEGEEDEGDADEDSEEEDRGDDAGDGDEEEETEEEEEPLDEDVLSELAGGRSTHVPIERFNEVLEQNRRLTNAVEAVAGASTRSSAAVKEEDAAPKFDLKGKLKERNEAALEGDIEKMTAIDVDIENYRIDAATAAALPRAEAKVLETITKEKLDEIVEAAFAKYPFLSDADKSKHSPEALADVAMYRDRYVSEGKSVPVALRMAINKVCPIYAKEFGEEADRGDGGGKKPKKKVGPDPNARTPEQIRRNAKLAKRLPERTGALGTSNRKHMRDADDRGAHAIPAKEYHDMPDREKKKARGDFV